MGFTKWNAFASQFSLLVSRVGSPITEHVHITEHFPMLSPFLNQIEQFFVSLVVQTGGLQMFFEHQK
jgi:hypothetical protein